MTLQPSPYELIRAIQDQQRATDRLVAILVEMLDGSAPDPVLTATAAIQPVTLPARPMPPMKRDRRLLGEAARPAMIVKIGGIEVRTSARRARLLSALRDDSMTLEEMSAAGLGPSVPSVKAQIIDLNADLERAGSPLRVVSTPGGQRIGAKGGRNPSTYRLVDPDRNVALLETANGTGECAPRPVGDGEEAASSPPDLVKPSAETDGGYSVDPEAQKDSVDRTGRRNAGVRRGGAVAAAELVAETVADIDRELSGAPPPSAAQASPPTEPSPPAPPSAGYVPGREKALDMWATTSMSVAEIADAVLMQPTSVRSAIDRARRAGDPRASARASAPKPTVPAAQPAAMPQQMPIEPGDLLAVDIKQKRIQTARGAYEVAGANLARALDRLRDGQLFGLDTIAKVAGWPSVEVARTALHFERNRLAQHDIDLWMDKINVRLREAN